MSTPAENAFGKPERTSTSDAETSPRRSPIASSSRSRRTLTGGRSIRRRATRPPADRSSRISAAVEPSAFVIGLALALAGCAGRGRGRNGGTLRSAPLKSARRGPDIRDQIRRNRIGRESQIRLVQPGILEILRNVLLRHSGRELVDLLDIAVGFGERLLGADTSVA